MSRPARPTEPAAPTARLDVRARRHDVDWLRIGATFLLFPFHVAKTFDVAPAYHLKNVELTHALDFFTFFVHQWHMPLFFLLAGWASCGTIRRRGIGGFRRERVRRLFVPFLVVSLLACPVLKYLELRCGLTITARGQERLGRPFTESFFVFLPTFYTRMDRFTWSHLWFLLYLFVFSQLYAGLFRALLAHPAWLGRVSAARLYLPLVPLVLIQATLRFRWPGVQNLFDDWANFAYYSLYLTLGFLIARDPAWEDVIAREWRRALVIGLGASALLMAALAAANHTAPPELAPMVVFWAVTAVAGWCTVVGILGAGRAFLSGDVAPGVRAYLAEASLPIYVLHQFAIVVPGYFIIQMAAGIPAKFALMLLTAVVATMATYHWVVRPVPVLRGALGMPSRRPEGR